MKLKPYNYKNVLRTIIREEIEKHHQLREIFNSPPFKTDFHFSNSEYEIKCDPFEDNQGNKIQVIFHKMRRECYEVDFTVNGSSMGNPGINYSIIEYTPLILTVFKCVEQFIKEYSPQALNIDGEDSFFKQEQGKEGQKNAIYKYALKKTEIPYNYTLLTNDNGGTQIIKKQ